MSHCNLVCPARRDYYTPISKIEKCKLGVLYHQLKCEMKSSHFVDVSWDLVEFMRRILADF